VVAEFGWRAIRDAVVFIVLILVLFVRPQASLGGATKADLNDGAPGSRPTACPSCRRSRWPCSTERPGVLAGLVINLGLFIILTVSLNLTSGHWVFSLGRSGHGAGCYASAILTLPLQKGGLPARSTVLDRRCPLRSGGRTGAGRVPAATLIAASSCQRRRLAGRAGADAPVRPPSSLSPRSASW